MRHAGERVPGQPGGALCKLAAALFALSASVGAQQVGGQPAPNLDGQWAGPWDLSATMEKTLDTQVMYDPAVWEIAHAALLPPDSPANAEDSTYGGKVLFINDRYTYDHITYPPSDPKWDKDQPTFVWNPGAPSSVEEHVMVGNTLHNDLFCSGHVFRGDGNLVTVGGLNRAEGGGLGVTPVGIDQSFVLRTDLAGSPPGALVWEQVSTLSRKRWYPSVVPLADGSLFTSGHGGLPVGGDRTHQTLVGDVWSSDEYNWALGTCSGTVGISLRDYPRLHLTLSGYLMFTNNEVRSPPYPEEYHVSSFMPQFGPPDCPAVPANPYQWREGVVSDDTVMGQDFAAEMGGGNSVHLITRDDANPQVVKETLYAIGGVEHGVDDKPCPCVEDDVFASDRVIRISDPDPTTAWEGAGTGTAPKNLNHARVNANSIVLLDGSILVVGGADRDPETVLECDDMYYSDACLYRKVPELYKPPEVFEGLVQTSWNNMAPQAGRRRYHSVAGMLPDGRVFSAGGTAPGDQKTVELFSPPYFFRGPRPSIETEFDEAQLYDSVKTIRVNLRGGGAQAAVKRVALIRNAAVTHAFDMNQRYVEVPIILGPNPVPGTTAVEFVVQWPVDGFEAPPGWYLLTVVADMDNPSVIPNANNLPSRAKWIFLE